MNINKSVLKLSLTAALSTLLIFPAFADSDSAIGNVSVSSVIQNLNKAGYQTISQVEFENGAYKVKAVNTAGQQVKLKVDANGNLINSGSTNPASVTMLSAANAVEAQGYKIHEIEFEHGKYQVKGVDSNGQSVKLTVDPSSGAVSKS